jgi:predicted peptidase
MAVKSTRWVGSVVKVLSTILALGYASWAGAQGVAVGQVPVLAPGLHDEMFSPPGQPRVRYALSVPDGYSASKPVPLVLALHFGGNPSGAALGLMKVLAVPGLADLGAVIVAPETMDRGWNTPANERAVIALLDAVGTAYRVDPRRVVVMGFSMGGAGTWHFASKFPNRFSAAIPMAGRPPDDLGAWKMPVVAIHSRADETVPFGPAEARIKQLKNAGVRADLIAVDGIPHYETGRFAEPLRRAVPWLRDTWKKLESQR